MDIATLETAYQVAHLMDAGQTYAAARNCYEEVDPLTSRLISRHPSEAQVAVWYAGEAVGHYVVTKQLEKWNAPAWAQYGWQLVWLVGAVDAVHHNWSVGLRFGYTNGHGCN